MEERINRRIGGATSIESVNVDSFNKLQLEEKSRLLPSGDINRILDVGEVFNNERQASPCYRVLGTIRPLISNVLFNTTGGDSWGDLITAKFRDRTVPSNVIDLDEDEDLTYRESIDTHLVERDGWYGYFDPEIGSATPCVFFDMFPKREHFSFFPQNKVKNWELTVTYPAESASTQGDITFGGLLVVEAIAVTVGGRDMTAFATPVKHGLTQGEIVNLTGLSPITLDGDYTVNRLGLDNGDLKGYYFVVDIDPTAVLITTNTRMVRFFAGEPSKYYYRKFKKVNVLEGGELQDNDYEAYPTAFAKNLYNDKIPQFVFNADVDITSLVDNLGRPLSELYLTVVKTPTPIGSFGNLFSDIKSGIEMPFIGGIDNFDDVPDISRIHNGGASPVQSHTPLDLNVQITDTEFFGDVVEYNRFELKEKILGEVHHRFNTLNRENGGIVPDPSTTDPVNINMGNRQEGYYYKAHHLMRIRDFSGYIEQGDTSTVGIPDYAENLGDGRFLWRDLLDIGFNDTQEEALNYPFLNGCHYLYDNFCLNLRRQDPFAQYGLYYSNFPRDPFGDRMTDNFEVKRAEDVC